MNGIPQLTNRVFPEQSEVPVEKAADAPDMPSLGVLHWQVFAARR